MINKPVGTAVRIEIESERDAGFTVVDMFGNTVLVVDQAFSGVESGSWTTELEGSYFVLPFVTGDEPGDIRVSASLPLSLLRDTDDGRVLVLGQTVVAAADHPLDVDHFGIDLAQGQTIDITIDSAMIDSILTIDFPGARREQMASDNNKGGGLFGLGAKLTYRAPHGGRFLIVVGDAGGNRTGGYVLTVAEAPAGAASVSPPPAPMSDTAASPFGPMALHESARHDFSMRYPGGWSRVPEAQVADGVVSFDGERGASLTIVEEDLASYGIGPTTSDEYIDRALRLLTAGFPDLRQVSHERVATRQGLSADVLVANSQSDTVMSSHLVYLQDGRFGFIATYSAPQAVHDKLEPLIRHSFASFEDRSPAAVARADAILGAIQRRQAHTATRLLDGRVLLSGGMRDDLTVLSSAALYDPSIGVWTSTDGMAQERRDHTATLLADGTVLVVGGHGAGPEIHTLAERYDPSTGLWSPAGHMTVGRLRHTATLLPDRRVLVTGGGFDSAELYDVATGSWSPTGSMAQARDFHGAALLEDGRVLVSGGVDGDLTVLSSAELYDPATGIWTPTGSMVHARRWHASTRLDDGRALVPGGLGESTTLLTAEIYDPATGAWSLTRFPDEGRVRHTSTLLADGRVLVVGGQGNRGILASAELYDPATNSWSPTGGMLQARVRHTATLLADGRVLVVGGPTAARAELYDPTTGDWSAR